MIYGIGTDIVQICRINAALIRHGDRFAERILGTQELITYRTRNAQSSVRGVRYVASRFAAKEAFSKAVRLGLRMPMRWDAMQTLNDASGAPLVVTSGKLADWMASADLRAHISISDEADYAVAFVVVEQA